MRKIIVLLGFITLTLSYSHAQNGNIKISDFLEITTSSLSNISNILLENKYTLRYAKKPTEEVSSGMVEMAWGYNAKYIETLNAWEIPKVGNTGMLKILMTKDNTPIIVMYCSNNREIYSQFHKSIVAYGYIKDGEEIDIESGSIRLMYDNHTTRSTVTFIEKTQSKDFIYTVDWYSWDITKYE